MNVNGFMPWDKIQRPHTCQFVPNEVSLLQSFHKVHQEVQQQHHYFLLEIIQINIQSILHTLCMCEVRKHLWHLQWVRGFFQMV